MRHLFVLGLLLASTSLFAYETWTDLETGISWKYQIMSDSTARIYGNQSSYWVSTGSGGQVLRYSHTQAIPVNTTGEITIPAEINGYPVTGIMSYAFYECSRITSVSIPNSIITIGDNAFYNCTSVMAVNLSEKLTSLGERCFCGCSNLTAIILPKGITTIRDSTFYGCTSLKDITICSDEYTLGRDAFDKVSPERFCASHVQSGIEKTMRVITIPEDITTIIRRSV